MIKAATLIGISAVAFKIGRAVLPYLQLQTKRSGETMGKYIIVTGCTDGIGKQWAKYYARLGIPLVLIARNQNKLAQLNKLLTQMSPSSPYMNKTVLIDYSHQNLTLDLYASKIRSLQLPAKSVSGIVNCCGLAVLQQYSEISWQEMQNVKKANTVSLQLSLKHLSFQCMTENPFFINISSHTACYPLAYSSVYSAAKAYCSNLLLAYAKQYSNVKVLSVEPWYVKTKMIGYQATWDTVEPLDVVQGSLRVLGKRNRCSGSIKHQLLYQFRYFMQKYNDRQTKQKYQRILKVKALKSKRLQRDQTNKLFKNKEQGK